MRRGAIVLACLGACGQDAVPDRDAGPDPVGVLTLSPPAFDFGDIDLNAPSPATTGFTLTNSTTADVELTSPVFELSGPDATDYELTNVLCPGELAPGESCGVVVLFRPRARVLHSATLGVVDNDATAALTGTGVSDRNLILFPGARNFGDIPTGTTGTPVTFTLINELADGPASLSALPAGFTLVDTTCTGTIPLHGSCTIDIALSPAHGGLFVGNLDITLGGETVTAGLTGASTSPLALAPFTQLFDQLLIGNIGGEETLTVTNTGVATTGTIRFAVLGPDFTFQSSTCQTLAPDASCTVTVKFTPAQRGAKTTQLEIGDQLSGLTTRSTLRGDAYALLIVGPATFPNTTVGQTSAPQTYTVINASSSQTGPITTSLVGNSDFAIASDTCAAGLAANSSCTIQLTLSPSGTGARSATLSVVASPGGTDDQVVSGNGT